MTMGTKEWIAIACGALTLTLAGCRQEPAVEPDPYDIVAHLRPGGAASTNMSSSKAYGQPVDGMTEEQTRMFDHGDYIFEHQFVPSGDVMSGLGPLYNNHTCAQCHPNEGRAPFPRNLNQPSGFFLRISSGNDPVYGHIGVPGFGAQLQQLAIDGVKPEAKFHVEWSEKVEVYDDGTKVVLHRPTFSISDTRIPLPAYYMLSPRIGMPTYGLGLLEAIPEEEILSHADPYDKDNDGISGKPNYVWDSEYKKVRIGRFGWKANTSSVMEQTCQAFVNDMGLTNRLYPVEEDWDRQGDGDPTTYEVPDDVLDAVVFYGRTLAVPAPRGLDRPVVKKGYKLFDEIGCAKCHVPTMHTGQTDVAALSGQTIYCYTDMLLHDMGEDLADNRPDHLADGHEWKTRPLWGIGLTYPVNRYEFYLHDGRARSLEQAILWHGGEADHVKRKFKALSKDDRDAILAFLRAL